MKDEKYGIGKIFKTKEGYEIIIIKKLPNSRRIIQFLDDYKAEINASCENIKIGSVSNPYHKSVYNFAYFGIGEYFSKIKGKNTPEYICWTRLLERISNKDDLKFVAYKNYSICEEWLNFQKFAKWYHNNIPKIEGINFEIDKDLLQQGVENKIYSPNTCIFLPYKINIFLSKKKLKNGNLFTSVHKPYKHSKKFISTCTDFNTGERKYLGIFDTEKEAYDAYLVNKNISTEQAKQYMRNIGIYSEEIIQLIN